MDPRPWFGKSLPKGSWMIDTHESIQIRFEKTMMQRSGAERLKMGCSMFDAAKEMACSSIFAENPRVSAEGLKKELFLRFYGQDFSPAQVQNIIGRLSRH
jgi:hypothetical protein